MKGGTVNIIDYVPWKDMDFFVKSSDMQLVSAVSRRSCADLQHEQKPFDDRRAPRLADAIDRQNVVDTVFFGPRQHDHGRLLPSNSPAYETSLKNLHLRPR